MASHISLQAASKYTANNPIKFLLTLPSLKGPRKLSTDNRPQFIATTFPNFLQTWGVKHCLSLAFHAQSNGRAELGIKTSKQILENNTCSDGTTDNNKVAFAIMQYHNTP